MDVQSVVGLLLSPNRVTGYYGMFDLLCVTYFKRKIITLLC